MQKAPNWAFHVVVYNMTAEETEQYAEEFEAAIKSHLLPCTIKSVGNIAFDGELESPESADVLFSFPTEAGLTPRSDVPILVQARCRIVNARANLRISTLAIEQRLTKLVHCWPNRDQASVFFDITN